MIYSIKHVTRFTYESSISESVMEARMQPRSDALQRCLHFGLSTQPASRVLMYQDHDGNVIHHFDIPGRHAMLVITAEALVECHVPPPLPEALDADAWNRLAALTASGEHWDLLHPSAFARPTALLRELLADLDTQGAADPLSALRLVAGAVYDRFDYCTGSTEVDSPIDQALQSGRGVCQDFAHIMIALGRELGIPCRYVSGYLFHRSDGTDRSIDGATHAWVEALLPDVGWVGFDPTNNVLAGERHIRVALGRDYADVPPTRGVYKGTSAVRSELAVAVRVGPATVPGVDAAVPFVPWMSREAPPSASAAAAQQQ